VSDLSHPAYAVETGTKLWWDWSKAGRDGEPDAVAEAVRAEVLAGGEAAKGVPPQVLDGLRRVGTDPDVRTHYDKKKGLFLIARRQVPEYRWYDGTTARHAPGQRYDGPEPLPMNEPRGRPHDAHAKIWPFKVHRGVQPFDAKAHHLLVPHTFGPGGYWSTFDWERALRTGAEASGVPYSGERTWIATEMWWPQEHMVAPKADALRCIDCHGEGGRMDWALGTRAPWAGRRGQGLLSRGGGAVSPRPASVLALGALAGPRMRAAPSRRPLLDAAGDRVLRPAGPCPRCGPAQCHDAEFIEAHDFTRPSASTSAGPRARCPAAPVDTSAGPFGRWDPATNRRLPSRTMRASISGG
jgi:hypothetical protein